MVFENLLTSVITAVGSATVISGLASLATDEPAWQWKKYLYTISIASIAALAIVEAQGGVTEANVIPLFLEIVGASFLTNKLVGIGQKLKGEDSA